MNKLNILLANRANAFSMSGGDTVIMRQLVAGLTERGHHVETEVTTRTLENADIIHIVNLTIKESEIFARAALDFGKPFVITALFEDWPLYINKSLQAIASFHRYLASGQNHSVLQEELTKIRSITGGPSLKCEQIIENAARLFACGEHEATRLRMAFPSTSDRITITNFGADGLPKATPACNQKMRRVLPESPFVLCCGRLETRKNQLMLMAALENCEVPIVFATGSGTVQPVYAELVKRFRRRGPVQFLEKLSGEELSATMSIAAAHVLPSWYELPGLVTLEAHNRGTAVVASSWGAIGDYLSPEQVMMCNPDCPESILNATMAAMSKPINVKNTHSCAQHTWAHFIDKTISCYNDVCMNSPHNNRTQFSVSNTPESPMSNPNSTPHRFDVSIIIPCYNRAELTKECVEAICQHDPRASYEVLFVDNGSTDETANTLKAIEGDVKVLRFNQNRGFAAACNQAACLAEGRYLVFLNNDTRPTAGWLDAMIATTVRNTNVGAVGSLLLYPDGTVQHAGIAVSTKKVPYHIFQNFSAADPAVQDEREMFAVTGACMMVLAATFQQLGGFDETYVNGFEDVDFCCRLHDAGYSTVFAPTSVVIHHEESSEGRKNNDRANFERFMNRWSAILVTDEVKLAAQYGYRIEWTATGGKYYRIEKEATANSVSAAANFDSLLSSAQTLYTNGKYDEAAETLQSIIKSSMTLAGDDGFETWQTLGNCLARLQRAEEAESAFCNAIKLNDQSERPYLGLGTLAMIEENWLAAQYSFMTALAKNPGTTKGEFGVGLSLAARNRHESALDHFSRVLAKEPMNEEALFYFYRSSMEAGKPEATIQPLENYVSAHPSDTNFMFHLCGAYWKAGQVLKAIDMCERVLKLNPNHDAAREIHSHFEKTLTVNA